MKTVLIFPKNFFNFRFDVIKKQSIKNLSRFRSKSYAFVVFGDSEEATFLSEEQDEPFLTIFQLCSVYIQRYKIEVLVIKFP